MIQQIVRKKTYYMQTYIQKYIQNEDYILSIKPRRKSLHSTNN